MVTRTFGGWFMEHDAVRSIEVAAEALKATTRVTRRMARTSDRNAASSSVHSIYKNQHPPLHFLYFTQKLHCQNESVTYQSLSFTSFSNNFHPLTLFLGK